MHFMVANEFLTTPPIFPRRWLVFKKMVSSLSVQWIITLTNPNSFKPVGREGKWGGGGGLLVMWLYYSGADQWTPP